MLGGDYDECRFQKGITGGVKNVPNVFRGIVMIKLFHHRFGYPLFLHFCDNHGG